MKRKLLVLGLTGLLVTSFAFAQTGFTALQATFKVLVNGKEFKSDRPAVTINGSTYLPLKAVGDALGVKVIWNNEKRQVEIGEPTTAAQYNRSNPAPIGTKQIAEVEDILNKYRAEITVKEVIRGDNAWSMIQQANQFNQEPQSGYEYILAKIEYKLQDINDDKSLNLSIVNFGLYSSDFKKYEICMGVEPTPSINSNLYKGASTEGWAMFQVKMTDEKPTIGYGQAYDGTGGVWFKAYK